MLQGKKVLLGITGSIAAYKSAILIRLLIKSECEVRVVMTKSACNFITPMTISTLSGTSVIIDWANGETWSNHVEAGLWADVMLIAPCTASTISKMAQGMCDNMLLACYLSAKCPVIIAPAMDLDMWKHPSTKFNLSKLLEYGNSIIPVGNGFLASGLHGDGRMAEPEEILLFLESHFSSEKALTGKKILITAGPTYEAIDPVRFIGNHSSGKMGFAIAEACARHGARVTLVSGPVHIHTTHHNIEVVSVRSAEEMYQACLTVFEKCDVAILAAAVADYRPSQVANQKIKKKDDDMKIELTKTVDIAASLGMKKKDTQIIIGFALETNDEINHAKQKLYKKNLDFIVLNSLSDSGAGFQHDTNKISIIDKQDNILTFDLKSKSEVADDIINYLITFFKS